jgi:transposase
MASPYKQPTKQWAADDRKRLEAITAYAMTNNASEASKLVGVSDNTINKWVADSPESLERIRRALQEEFVPELVELGRVLLQKLSSVKDVPVSTARDAQSLAVTFGIVVDKMAQLLGIKEQIELSGGVLMAVAPADLETRERLLGERRRALQSLVIDVPSKPSER